MSCTGQAELTSAVVAEASGARTTIGSIPTSSPWLGEEWAEFARDPSPHTLRGQVARIGARVTGQAGEITQAEQLSLLAASWNAPLPAPVTLRWGYQPRNQALDMSDDVRGWAARSGWYQEHSPLLWEVTLARPHPDHLVVATTLYRRGQPLHQETLTLSAASTSEIPMQQFPWRAGPLAIPPADEVRVQRLVSRWQEVRVRVQIWRTGRAEQGRGGMALLHAIWEPKRDALPLEERLRYSEGLLTKLEAWASDEEELERLRGQFTHEAEAEQELARTEQGVVNDQRAWLTAQATKREQAGIRDETNRRLKAAGYQWRRVGWGGQPSWRLHDNDGQPVATHMAARWPAEAENPNWQAAWALAQLDVREDKSTSYVAAEALRAGLDIRRAAQDGRARALREAWQAVQTRLQMLQWPPLP